MFGSYFGMPSAYQMIMGGNLFSPGQVKTGPVSRTPPMGGGLLGGMPGGQMGNAQSFNPFGSASAGLFNEYMNRQMRMSPGGFFGFMPPQFAQPQAPVTPPPEVERPRVPDYWASGTIGGGN